MIFLITVSLLTPCIGRTLGYNCGGIGSEGRRGGGEGRDGMAGI
jgi:hypothetical protein